jgi:murein DD-endopeptidase MepM/ murein hydrolase activator NlpD
MHHRIPSRIAISMLALASLFGCDGSSGPEVSDEPSPSPSSGAATLPMFNRPFNGEFRILNYFDHDIPNGGLDPSGGYQLTWRGERSIPGIHIGGYDGHTGVDWIMPVGTPLLAMADGLVLFAGETAPRYCWLQDEVVSQVLVSIGHRAPNGDIYVTDYNHMSRADVTANQRVTPGQQVGLSGASGCVGRDGTPHLHLNVSRISNTNNGEPSHVDPYGWEGSGIDPWAQHPSGATSVWLWRPGEAPSLVR